MAKVRICAGKILWCGGGKVYNGGEEAEVPDAEVASLIESGIVEAPKVAVKVQETQPMSRASRSGVE